MPAYTYNTGMFPPAENEFIAAVAAYTGLAPQVVAGWALAEEPPGGASVPSNPYNFLNIAMPGSSYAGAPTNIWQNPLTAAQATAEWIETGKGVPGWSHPGGIPIIKQAAGQSIAQQIYAIQHSGWAASGYPDLPQDVAEVAGRGKPPSVPPYTVPGGTATIQPVSLLSDIGGFFGDAWSAISGTASDMAKAFSSIGLFFAALISPIFWLRVGEILLGAFLMLVGVTLYFAVLFGLAPGRARRAIGTQMQQMGAVGSTSARIIKVVGQRRASRVESRQTLLEQRRRTLEEQYISEKPQEPKPERSTTRKASANRKKISPRNKRAGKRTPKRK